MNKNPLTFKHIEPYSIPPPLPPSGPYRNPVHAWGIDPYAMLNRMISLWGTMLWEARKNLIDKYKLQDPVNGFNIASNLILRLVVDGQKLSTQNPTPLEARDAILLADRVLTGGANLRELWQAFANRGMGWSATYFFDLRIQTFRDRGL